MHRRSGPQTEGNSRLSPVVTCPGLVPAKKTNCGVKMCKEHAVGPTRAHPTVMLATSCNDIYDLQQGLFVSFMSHDLYFHVLMCQDRPWILCLAETLISSGEYCAKYIIAP